MKETKQKFCQSCGMPMTEALYGHESDGTLSKDYCKYCYDKGQFLADCTMTEMIDFCAPLMKETMSETEAKEMMRQWFPTLKRWRKQ